jgi:hypothetical protein
MPEPLGSKLCRVCREVKPLIEFYRNSNGRGDGFGYSCKTCTKIKSTQWRKDHITDSAALLRRAASQKRYTQSARGKIKRNQMTKKLIRLNLEKYHARYTTDNAVSSGQLVRQPCLFCGSPETEAHHDDYSKPLSIEWLCQKHHREVHRYFKYQRQFE